MSLPSSSILTRTKLCLGKYLKARMYYLVSLLHWLLPHIKFSVQILREGKVGREVLSVWQQQAVRLALSPPKQWMVEVTAVSRAPLHVACLFACVCSTEAKIYISSFPPPSPTCVYRTVPFDVGLLVLSRDACAAGIADARTVIVFGWALCSPG